MRNRMVFTLVGLVLGVIAGGCGRDQARVVNTPRHDAPPTSALATSSTPLPLVPHPRSLTRTEGAFTIEPSTSIVIAEPAGRAVAEQLVRWLGRSVTKDSIVAAKASRDESGIVLRLVAPGRPRDPAVEPPLEPSDEAYTLDVSRGRVVVEARSAAGLFYGAQTLAQLAGARRIGSEPASTMGQRWVVPCVSISDAPRFPFRAMHLDVARHFFSKEVVERYIDLLAFYRYNVFHWHLTDDQGFRFEVKGHPELTAVGGRDGFFTQEDARQIVAYARDRAITVMPEVEMPGHARAILAAHPELSCTGKPQAVPRTWGVFDDVLCAGNEASYALVGHVLEELTNVFPSRLIHVGGDEVPEARWGACPKCRAKAKAAGVAMTELESVFMHRVATTLKGLGRRMVVWDEALTSDRAKFRLPPETVILAWQSKERGREAVRLGHDVVMAPHDHVYFNIRQSGVKGEPGHEGLLPWTTVRAFDPIPPAADPTMLTHVLGGEGALWTEHVVTAEQIDAMVMPRMAALAEALWSGPASSEADFVTRWNAQVPALDASKLEYFIEPPTGLRAKQVFAEAGIVSIAPPRLFPSALVRWTRDGSDPVATSPVFDAQVRVEETTSIAAAAFLPGGRRSPVARSIVTKERPRASQEVRSPVKGALYTYAEGDFHRLPDFTRLTPRSRGRTVGIGLLEVERARGSPIRKEHFAVLFEGSVRVPADGVYRFVARADDGVRVEVDRETVVEDDGEHAPREADGEIALQAGFHPVRIFYFQGSEGLELDVKLEGPGLPLGPIESVISAAP